MKLCFTATNQRMATKMAKFHKMAKCVFSCPAQLKNGQIFRHWPWNSQSGNHGSDWNDSLESSRFW